MLDVRNTPVDDYKFPAKLACRRQLQSILLVSPNNLTVKPVDNDEFKQKKMGYEKQARAVLWLTY